MKLSGMFIIFISLCLFADIQTGMGQSSLESGRLIPVYPGSSLITEFDPGEEAVCCNFKTNDGFEKVVSFYESSLKLKALDITALATQHPSLKGQTDMLLKEMPAGMKIRFFVLKVVEFQGRQGAELFEIYTSPQGVEFSLMESQLLPADRHFSEDFEKAVKDEPKPVDIILPRSILPSTPPAGYTEDDLKQDGHLQLSTSYTKVIRPRTLTENDGDIGLSSNIEIIIYGVEKADYEEQLNPYEEDKVILVKGKYKGIERTTKQEDGYYSERISLGVNNRFIVIVEGRTLNDPKIILQLLDKINLDALPK